VTTPRRLDTFTGAGYDRGRGVLWQVAWFAASHLVFQSWWLPARLRPMVLRAFGAKVGIGSNIRNGVRIHWPWKLTLGDHVWIGEGAWLLDLEPITVGSHVCISQDAVLCTGSHDVRSPSFEFDNAPIVLGDGVWIMLRAVVLRGVVMPEGALAPAGTVVRGPSDYLLGAVSKPRTSPPTPNLLDTNAVLDSSEPARDAGEAPWVDHPSRRAKGQRPRRANGTPHHTPPTSASP
jgi:putative colanic acid biosynthesis acetyltransferase WcaF